ncbi:ubr1 ubiquitin ligase [Calliopsis andreniformis]|uniref:ubr1 ubiquitin ligase n=1 Tax=Calliopsis andreniformis TaxID=337506 RepID=UPI003FCC3622
MSEENVQDSPDQNIEDAESPSSIPVHPKFSQPCVSEWMQIRKKGELSCTHFKKHWRVWVPKIYNPELNRNCLDSNFDDEIAQKLLFYTLGEFICNGDPEVVLKQLCQTDNIVCGKVFKMGDPTYNCRECGMDLTCVLCVDCFKQSAHRNHKYKMGTSSGGGCCDCGDTEAWKSEPFCNIHKAGSQAKESRGNNKLPGDIAERAVVTFEAVLRYCYEMLSLEHTITLPPDLQVKETDEGDLSLLFPSDTFCTVLFNDETHTFDQVISTLTYVLKCSQKDAVEYVTNVDREGRAVVRCSGFQQCEDLKFHIERLTLRHSNKALKVLVVHAYIIAHQTFAMKLLSWLQEFISLCEGFKLLLSIVALNTRLRNISIVEGILMRDSQLWKSARTAWHRLFMVGMLTVYETKKDLAIVFTRCYGAVMKDFIRDDHDHSFSIVSLSVQLFTVPTLAHYLIAHHDVLFILLNTFISESSRRCNTAGKLEFERNIPNASFRRAQHILNDLRYLLGVKPEVWTDDLRRGFLHGLSCLLTLFCSMQGMDAVVRQLGQHMEYEPEWESAFNLHLRLSPVITLALEWCGSDRIVLVKAFKLVLSKLYEQPGHEFGPTQVRELADHSATCLQYDVSSEPVSIHLPLSRFLAGLFLYLEKHNLHFQYTKFIKETKPTPEQIIEPVLVAQVMISQVLAGMWRRNGYSLLNQLYFYHNVKCRSEMLDRDIVLLQAGASLIESNEFLIHVLNKFNLLNWANPDFETNDLKNPEEDNIRQTINLVEEFLLLLITIIGERSVPGVGQVTPEDRLKKEIIQQLCVEPLSHSELNKTLPDDGSSGTGMENVIHEVADFKKPSQASAGKGVYQLKPHLYSEYNVFFYHCTKEELSKSEEVQRKRRKALGELECCPPPKLPKLTEVFSLVTNLLQCDVMLHIMQTVLERALNLMARSFSEPQVHRVLHLIGYALQEQESGYYPFFAFTARAGKWKIYKLLEDLRDSPRIDAHKDLLTWVLNKYREVAGNTVVEVSQTPATLQKEATSDTESSKSDKEWRIKMAAQKREEIMAQMVAMQNHFMKKNAKLFEETASDMNKSSDLGSTMDLSETVQKTPVALGSGQTARMCKEKTYTCILCQENQTVTATSPAMVLAAFVQQSTVLCQNRADTSEPCSLFLSANLGLSPHTSTCGHVMHADCWQKYFGNVLAKENRRPFRLRQPASFDVEKHEYLCPLCECLGNTVLPLLPALGTLQPTAQNHDLSFVKWFEGLKAAECHLEVIGNSEDCNYRYDDEDEDLAAAEILQPIYDQPGPTLSKNLISMIHLFEETTYTKRLHVTNDKRDKRGKRDPSHANPMPLLVWKTTAYTFHAIEFLLRDMNKPLLGALSSRQRDSLESLARISAILGSVCANNVIVNHAFSYLAMVLRNLDHQTSILDWDPFGVLVPLVNTLPSVFHAKSDTPRSIITGGICEFYALQLVFIALIVKILITTDFNEGMDIENQETNEESFSESILILVPVLGIKIGTQTAGQIWRRVKEACLPFLRCCALYFHYVTDVAVPEELTQVDGATYENICAYLGLPTTCDELIKPNINIIMHLINIWISHPTVQEYMSGTSTAIVIKEPLKVNKLVELPEDYSELINMISSFTCPNSEREDSKNPTMCLVCGEMLCSQSYCCQTELNKIMVGACTYHASKCGAGVGIFLRVRECEILFLRSPNRGSFVCPPYLDEYGETDQGLRRGNPLRLCHDKYKQLNQMWLGHGLHESISRAIESSSSFMSTRWQRL